MSDYQDKGWEELRKDEEEERLREKRLIDQNRFFDPTLPKPLVRPIPEVESIGLTEKEEAALAYYDRTKGRYED